jgi:hypothetical protein
MPAAMDEQPPRSLDQALLELLQLLLVVRSHLLEQAARCERLLFIDLGDREADVDQYPVTGAGTVAVCVEESDADVATHSGNVHPSEAVRRVHHLQNLAGNGQAHTNLPQSMNCAPSHWRRVPRP